MGESFEPRADGASSDLQRARDEVLGAEAPPRWLFVLLLLLALIGALGGGYAIAKALTQPVPERVVEVRVGAPVLDSVRELARLETVSFHMERVVELKEEQKRAFGLVTAADAILLVAAADVSAGVDLQALGPNDVVVDPGARSVRLRLPAASVFQVALDEEHTYVHSRTTDLLAKRNVGLEGQARRAALADLREAAERAGILKRAETGARKTLESLLKSLGYTQISIEFAPAPKAPAAR